MRPFRLLIIAAAAVILAGCAAHPDPIIDKMGVDEEVFAQCFTL